MAKRVVRVQTADGFVRGTMEAQVGMVAENVWRVLRVNEKSVVIVRDGYGEWRRTDTLAVSIAEARKFGWPGNAITKYAANK